MSSAVARGAGEGAARAAVSSERRARAREGMVSGAECLRVLETGNSVDSVRRRGGAYVIGVATASG